MCRKTSPALYLTESSAASATRYCAALPLYAVRGHLFCKIQLASTLTFTSTHTIEASACIVHIVKHIFFHLANLLSITSMASGNASASLEMAMRASAVGLLRNDAVRVVAYVPPRRQGHVALYGKQPRTLAIDGQDHCAREGNGSCTRDTSGTLSTVRWSILSSRAPRGHHAPRKTSRRRALRT